MARGTFRRAQATLLALILLTGGVGLPVIDAVWFHHIPPVTATRPGPSALGVAVGGQAHIFGCAIPAAVSVTGLPAAAPTTVVQHPPVSTVVVAARPATIPQTEPVLQQSRAPPVV
ncbi:MAG TPA: hypothetical protein VNH46_02390 [Gemmatimonadales bacterium]|nr:hypothetical protein [Gemmatimonadales bacterium]